MHCLAVISRTHFIEHERKLEEERKKCVSIFSLFCSKKTAKALTITNVLGKGWIYLPLKMLLEKAVSAANRTPTEHDDKGKSVFALTQERARMAT